MRYRREIGSIRRVSAVRRYQPMTLADLAQHLIATAEERVRWKLVWEFLEEYRWEPSEIQIGYGAGRATTGRGLAVGCASRRVGRACVGATRSPPASLGRTSGAASRLVPGRVADLAGGCPRSCAGCVPQARRISCSA